MVEVAGRFLARMTEERYPELVTQPSDKDDRLAAWGCNGSLKQVDPLSEGTRPGYLSISLAATRCRR